MIQPRPLPAFQPVTALCPKCKVPMIAYQHDGQDRERCPDCGYWVEVVWIGRRPGDD